MAGSITKQFDFIINSAAHAVSKKCDLKSPRSASFNYFVAESIMRKGGRVADVLCDGALGLSGGGSLLSARALIKFSQGE
jgi:hypothetical protein